MEITTTSLSRLGIVVGTFDGLGMAGVIDSCLPKIRESQFTAFYGNQGLCV